MKVIGERLKEARKDAGLTQEELAQKLHLSLSAIKSYEQNISAPDDETKVAIAKMFNISLDYLLGAIDEEIPLNNQKTIRLPKALTQRSIQNLREYIELLVLRDSVKALKK